MWELKPPEKAVPFCALMFADGFELTPLYQQLLKDVYRLFGFKKREKEGHFTYGPVNFSAVSRYYDSEIGAGVKKIYMVLPARFDPGRLSKVKINSNELEKVWAKRLKSAPRPVNVDPGYLAASKLVLATTKNYYHRVYIGKGIYAEVTLYFKRGLYRAFQWTYPDYADENFRKWLSEVRNSIKDLLF